MGLGARVSLTGSVYLIALFALIAVGIGLALGVESLPVAARWHIVFTLGVVPLILAAMLYFVPVLTRRAPVTGAVRTLPWLAWLAGVVLLIGMTRLPDLRIWAALLLMGIVLAMLAWMYRQTRSGLSSPHPGLYWYVAALLCLLAGLLAITLALLSPSHWPALRMFHLHINLLGFLGMTAWGTLRVLLPTVSSYRDEQAAQALRQGVGFALSGSVLIAIGAAGWPMVSYLGALLLLLPSWRWLWTLTGGYRHLKLSWHSASTPLSLAAVVFAALPLLGVVHALGELSGTRLLELFLVLLLCPLLIGASSYLLPVWRFPGATHLELTNAREVLMRGMGLRTLGLLAAALLLTTGSPLASYLAALIMLSYALQAVFLLRKHRN